MIPKSESLKVQQEQHAAMIAETEKKIDAMIADAPGRSITYGIGELPDAVVNAIVDKYEKGGWSTRIDKGYNPRDQGSWQNLILS